MHDFTTADPQKIYNEVLRKRIADLKKIGKDGKSKMSKKLEKIIKEESNERVEANNREIARSLHADGIDDEHIARYTRSTVEQVKAWLR